MNKNITEHIERDLKILSYQCDEIVATKKIRLSDYFQFCKGYYYFLKILRSINWKNPEITQTIQKFPALEIPPLNALPVIIFLFFILSGVLLHSLPFVFLFIFIPLSLLVVLTHYSIVKTNQKKIIQIIHVCSELRTKIHLKK